MTYWYGVGTTAPASSTLVSSQVFNLLNNVCGSAGYTFVETLDVGSRSYIIFKNSSANNSRMDYFFSVNVQQDPVALQTTRIQFSLFEDWNTSSKTAIRFAPVSRTANGTDWAVDSPAYLPGSDTGVYELYTHVASGYIPHVWAKKNLIVFSSIFTNSASQASDFFKPIMIGLYDTFGTASADPAPLFITTPYSGYRPSANWGDSNNNSSPYYLGQDGRSTRSALNTNAEGFITFLIPLTAPSYTANAFTKQFLFSKALVANVPTSVIDYKQPKAIRGICPDIYFGINSLGINLQTQWVLAGSTYYARNITTGGLQISPIGYGTLTTFLPNGIMILE